MPRTRSHADPLSRETAVVLSCEHAGYAVPRAFRHIFAADPSILTTHRGYDIGIASVAARMAEILGVSLIAFRTSRLVIEPNRSLHHRALFSALSRDLPAADKTWLIEHLWKPHRQAVTAAIERHIGSGKRVLHLALHSFTPVLEGKIRTADVGLLYDPRRHREKRFAIALQHTLLEMTRLGIRRNYPFRGNADGLTTALRQVFAPGDYLGLEIELNQGLLVPARKRFPSLGRILSRAVRLVLSEPDRCCATR